MIAAGVAFLFAGVIFAFWIFSVMPNFAHEQAITARVESASPSPFATLSQILSQGTSGIGGELAKLKSASSGFFSATQIINNAIASTTAANQAGAVGTSTSPAPVSTTTNVIQ